VFSGLTYSKDDQNVRRPFFYNKVRNVLSTVQAGLRILRLFINAKLVFRKKNMSKYTERKVLRRVSLFYLTMLSTLARSAHSLPYIR
jgi:hypothetical protein